MEEHLICCLAILFLHCWALIKPITCICCFPFWAGKIAEHSEKLLYFSVEFFRELLHLLLKPRLNHLFRGRIKKFKVFIDTELHGGDDGMFELFFKLRFNVCTEAHISGTFSGRILQNFLLFPSTGRTTH